VVGFLKVFQKGAETFKKVSHLAMIPIILDVIFYWHEGLVAALSETFRVGVKFSLPFDLPSIESFYDFPKTAVQSLTYSIILMTIFAFIRAFVLGGYLGEIYQASENFPPITFTKLSHKYFTRFLSFEFLWLILILPTFFIGVAAIAYVIFLLILGYFLYLTPFIIIADDASFSKAIRKSVMLASGKTEVLTYAFIFLALTGIISTIIYLLMNIPVLGFLISVIITSIVGSIFTAATMNFYIDLQKSSDYLKV